jgi:adenylate cyclase
MGARGVLFDILFTEPSMYGPEDDTLFANLIRDSKIPAFMPAASEKGFVKEPIPVLREAITGVGGVHFSVDVDGIVRRAPPKLPGVQGEVFSLPEAMYQVLTKPSDIHPDTDHLLRFYQPKGIPFVSFYDLMLAYRDLENGKPLDASIQNLKDRVLVVGFSAPGLHDLKPIPTDNEAPGVLVPATALANRLSGEGLSLVSLPIYLGISFALLLALLVFGSLIETPKLSALLVGFILP